MRLPFLLACLLASAAAHAAPTEVRAEYTVSKGGFVIGRVVEKYERKGDTYRIESITRSEGVLKLFLDESITLSSEGRITDGGLQPLKFAQRRGGDRSRDIAATFDWDRSLLHSEFRGERKEIPLPVGTQDRLSVMYQFMNIVPGSEVRLNMSNGRKVDAYTYRRVADEALKTAAGDFDAAHFERITETEKESHAQIWIAKDRFNLPIRVVFEDSNGLRLEQNLVNLSTR
jgi:hypothetical protein